MNQLPKKINALKGIPFIKELLKFEQARFDNMFALGSVYEDTNAEFGIFPFKKLYPVYFLGDIRKPKNKLVVIGINPAHNDDPAEQAYLERYGLFEGYCDVYKKHGPLFRKSRYFANIGGFLRRMGLLDGQMTGDWLHDNLINLDFIPYHSTNTNGIRINDVEHYRERFFRPIVKLIEHIDPQKPIFIVGFPTFKDYFSNDKLKELILYREYGNVWVGTIAGKYKFIGLPFLTRIKGGKDKLVSHVKHVSRKLNLKV